MARGVLETAVGVLFKPTETLREIGRHPPVGWAILVVVVVSVVDALSQPRFRIADIVPPEIYDFYLQQGVEIPGEVGGPSIVGAITSPFFWLTSIAVLAGIYHLVSIIFRGNGSYAGLFAGFSFSVLPFIFSAPLALVTVVMGTLSGLILSGLGRLVLLGWVTLLLYYAIKENYSFSTGRALLVYLLPALVFTVLIIGLTVALVVLILATLGAVG